MLLKIIYIFQNSLRMKKMHSNSKNLLFSPRKLGSTLIHVELLGFSEYFNGISSEFVYCVFLILDKFSSNTDIDKKNFLRHEEGDL